MNTGYAAVAIVVALFASVFVLGPLLTVPIAVPNVQARPATGNAVAGDAQKVYLRALSTGVYDKQTLTVAAGRPVELHFTADLNAGCGRLLVVPDFKVQLISNGDEKVATFTPANPGRYPYRCGMNMFRGTLEVTP